MTVLLDKNAGTGVKSIFYTNDGQEYDQFYWNMSENTSLSVDNVNFKLGVTAANVSFGFENASAMQTYLDQYFKLHPISDIAVNGIVADPYYDAPKTGSIVSHTYVDTDVEKDLIQGN